MMDATILYIPSTARRYLEGSLPPSPTLHSTAANDDDDDDGDDDDDDANTLKLLNKLF